MNFRSLPFQFTPSDPAARQLELQRRFGLPDSSKGSEMIIDLENSSRMTSMGGDCKSGSPRLQHRIPMFMEGSDHLGKQHSGLCRNNVDGVRKPRERIVPIQVEGGYSNYPTRHRTFSGPAGYTETQSRHNTDLTPPVTKRFMQDNVLSATETFKNKNSQLYNVPVKIEGKGESHPTPVKKNIYSDLSVKKPDASEKSPYVALGLNSKVHIDKLSLLNPKLNISQQKITKVLDELNLYRTEVQEFSGTIKDKQYRYLDEMLTRCMINLDDVDTMGNEQIRSLRKAAIKEVQLLVDMLESKLTPVCSGDTQVEQSESLVKKSVNVEMMIEGDVTVAKDVEMKQAAFDAAETCEGECLSSKETRKTDNAEIIVNNSKSNRNQVDMKNTVKNELKDNEHLENTDKNVDSSGSDAT